MSGRSIEEHLEHMPLFPLPGALLFPTMTMPLHIFESRYRKMVRDARRSGLPIAIGHIMGTGPSAGGKVQVHPVVGAGFIDELQELPDGRFMIQLVGECRLRIVDEKDSPAEYRIVRCELLCDQPEQREQASPAIEDLRHVILAIHQIAPRVANALSDAVARFDSAGKIADSLASLIQTDPLVRQRWLDESNPVTRLRAVTEAISTFVVQSKIDSEKAN